MTQCDRTVHATLASGDLIVRHDRAGKWYRESEGKRFTISFREAVRLAQLPGATHHADLPGGKLFDRAVRGQA